MAALTNLITLNVFVNLAGHRIAAGRLVLSDGRIAWQYDSALLKRELQLSPLSLPLSTETTLLPPAVSHSNKRGLPGFIADALPDHWGNRLLESALQQAGLTTINALDRLAWQGSRGIGALEFEPEFESKEATNSWSYKQLLLQTRQVLSGNLSDIAQPLQQAGGSAGGAYPKYTAAINDQQALHIGSDKTPAGYRPILLKVPGSDDRQNRVEHVYAQMAAEAGIDVPRTELIEADGGAWLAIDRFDRYGKDYKLKRHQVTLAGLLDREFDRQPTTAEEAVLACKQLTRHQGDTIELIRRIVFNYLGHNCDDHAKNFSFHLHPDRNWRLAPWYDGAWCLNDGGHAMTLGGSGIPGRRDRFYQLAKKIGFRQTDTVIEQALLSLGRWQKLAANHGVSAEAIARVQTTLDANRALLN